MKNLQAILDAVSDVTIGVRTGTAAPDALWAIDFFSASAELRTDTVYLLTQAELPALALRKVVPATLFLVACASETPPALPAEVPDSATVVFVRGELLPLYASLNRCMETLRIRGRIDDIFLLAENMNYTPEQLVLTLSQMLGLGVFVLNASFQRISGAAAEFSANPYSQELARTGALSPESVRALRSGSDPSALLYEISGERFSRFSMLLIWRAGARIDAQYLCRRLQDFITDFRSRNSPPDIPPFLIDQRLNRILEGNAADDTEIASFFGTGFSSSWFSVLVLATEPGSSMSPEGYQRLAHMLLSAFRNISVTVVRSQVCAVVQIPILHPQDAVFSRTYFREHSYREGWDIHRLARELQQCGAYLCRSPIFQAPRFFPVEFSLLTDALDIAIRMDSFRGQRIVYFHDYSPYIAVKYAIERFLQKHSAFSLRALLHPEVVTLLLHDFNNHGDLAEVLYRYYIYGDVKATAQSLFVHRNTVYNKLKTIQKLLNVDLDDPAVRNSYLSSLRLYFYCEKCLGLDLHSLT